MAKFVYKLQNILDIKMRLETQARTAYAQAQARLNEEENKLKELFARRAGYQEAYRQEAQSGKIMDFAAMARLNQSCEIMDKLIQRQRVSVDVANKNLELARGRLNDAMQDRKTHEKLREKAFQDFLVELNDEEKKEIDELVSFKYNNSEE